MIERIDRQPTSRLGASLVEALIAVVILAVALLALAASGAIAARQIQRGRDDISRWAALQQQVEALQAAGYDAVEDGSAVVQGYPMSWTVSGEDPKKVTLTVERPGALGGTVTQTYLLFLADLDRS